MFFRENDTNKYNSNDDDLNFIPLNIEEPLAPNGTKFPLQFNINGLSINKNLGSISLNFPNLNSNQAPFSFNTDSFTNLAPLTPYPENIPELDLNTPLNENNNNNYELEDEDSLYSYNEPSVNERYLDDSINIFDILRNFDISVDCDSSQYKIDEIFEMIKKDNPGILATMKTYKIPYPICKLLIKKIIKISLDNCKE